VHENDQPNGSPSESQNDAIYLAAYGASVIEDETLRAVGISQLGVEGPAAATFRPVATAVKNQADLVWSIWLEGTFCSRLGPVFVKVYEACNEMRIDDVFVIDREIDGLLSLEERTASLEASESYREGKQQIQQLPQWDRMVVAMENEETPGHLPTLFAIQCAVFGLPLLSALVAYTYFEWHLGMCHAGGIPSEHRFRHFQERHPSTFLSVRRVFSSTLNAEDAAPQLASV